MKLEKHKSSNIKLFFYGMIIGCLVEYFSSYIGEIFLHAKWWDYSNDFLNINGRTCLYYAVMWGGLSIILIKYVNPFVDKLIENAFDKITPRILKFGIGLITLFMLFDGVITCVALDNFLVRVAKEYDINILGVDENKKQIIDLGKEFDNEKMMMIYPNMIIIDEKEENISLESVLTGVKNYYYKFGFIK